MKSQDDPISDLDVKKTYDFNQEHQDRRELDNQELHRVFYGSFDASSLEQLAWHISHKSELPASVRFCGEGTFFRTYCVERGDLMPIALKLLKTEALLENHRGRWQKYLGQVKRLRHTLLAPIEILPGAVIAMPFGQSFREEASSPHWQPLNIIVADFCRYVQIQGLDFFDPPLILAWKDIPFLADVSDLADFF